MIEVQDILNAHLEEYFENHKLSLIQGKAVKAITSCRTAKLGGHIDTCPNCGEVSQSYNSCRNRHCPKCQALSKEKWIDARKADLLNTGYFHVIFTVPSELNSIIYSNQKDCYNLIFRCASETLKELASDNKYLGAEIALTAVLHTWGQNLCFHPHIHCIVPAGGLNKQGFWVNSKKKFFLPVKVVSRKFRGKFLALLKELKLDVSSEILETCYNKEWVVYCKPPFKTAACVVEYLGRYTHRIAISNNRILKLENGNVTFKWRDYKDCNKWKEMTLTATEFIRRFLMHVLPHGFMKIRHFGFLSSRGKQLKLPKCKTMTNTFTQNKRLSTEEILTKILGRKPSVCKSCGFDGIVRTNLSPPLTA
ncbi:MAG: IS91 family transposase [Clostridia bacterium]